MRKPGQLRGEAHTDTRGSQPIAPAETSVSLYIKLQITAHCQHMYGSWTKNTFYTFRKLLKKNKEYMTETYVACKT